MNAIVKAVSKEIIIPVAVGVGSAALGAVGGFFYGKRKNACKEEPKAEAKTSKKAEAEATK